MRHFPASKKFFQKISKNLLTISNPWVIMQTVPHENTPEQPPTTKGENIMKATTTYETYEQEYNEALRTASEKLSHNIRINSWLEMVELYRQSKEWDREHHELTKMLGYLMCLADLKQITTVEALAFYEYHSQIQ